MQQREEVCVPWSWPELVAVRETIAGELDAGSLTHLHHAIAAGRRQSEDRQR